MMKITGAVAGIDGGGTKTIGMIADLEGKILADCSTEATNPNVVGLDAAANTICALIRTCCSTALLDVSALRAVVLGLAGAGGNDVKDRLRHSIAGLVRPQDSGPLTIEIVTDARIALEGAFAGGPGIVVMAGTGSVVMFKTHGRDVVLAGGWGRILGDEGSGHFIGLEALKAVTRDFEGRQDAGMLRRAVAEKFGLNSRERLIEAVYRRQFSIPSVAPLVFDAAAQGDPASIGILNTSAVLLAEQACAAVARMGEGPVPMVLGGGLLERNVSYRELVTQEISRRSSHVHFQSPQYAPARGAIIMALAQLEVLRV